MIKRHLSVLLLIFLILEYVHLETGPLERYKRVVLETTIGDPIPRVSCFVVTWARTLVRPGAVQWDSVQAALGWSA